MAYPDDGDPVVARLLETLRTNMAAIAPTSFHHTVNAAFVYEGRQIVAGMHKTVIVIVPGQDDITGFTSCIQEDHLLTVAVVGAIKFRQGSQDWKTQGRWLLADMKRALSQDVQLGGDVVYAEPISEDLFDAGGDTIAVCQLLIRVNYRHQFDNPSITA